MQAPLEYPCVSRIIPNHKNMNGNKKQKTNPVQGDHKHDVKMVLADEKNVDVKAELDPLLGDDHHDVPVKLEEASAELKQKSNNVHLTTKDGVHDHRVDVKMERVDQKDDDHDAAVKFESSDEMKQKSDSIQLNTEDDHRAVPVGSDASTGLIKSELLDSDVKNEK